MTIKKTENNTICALIQINNEFNMFILREHMSIDPLVLFENLLRYYRRQIGRPPRTRWGWRTVCRQRLQYQAQSFQRQ